MNYTLDLNAGLTQVLSDGTNTYLYGVGRIAQVNTTTLITDYFMIDALGSVRQLTDSQGEITLANAYDPYGTLAQTAGSAQTSYGFTGEYTDPSGMVYLRARYYSPAIGRFQTRDTWMGDYYSPLSLNRWMYVEGNPVNYIDPSGHDGDIPEWAEKRLEELRINTKQCYENGDTRCVWRNYRQLALFAPYFGLPYAAAHLNRYLFKMGDIHYYGGLPPYPNYHQVSSSKWVFGNNFVRKPFRQETREMWRKIHLEVLTGKTSGDVTTDESPTTYPDDRDMYYALGEFYVSITAHYEVSGCSVTIKPIYRFHDTYDWHPGLPAGGGIVGLAGFQDAWTASLKPRYAKEFEIFGVWAGPNKVYRLNSAWFFDWPASRNTSESWEYADSSSKYVDILRLDD